MKQILAILLTAMVILCLFAGCSSSQQCPSTDSSTASDNQTVSKSSKSTAIIAMMGDFGGGIGNNQNGRMIASLVAPSIFRYVLTDSGSYKYVADDTIVESYAWSKDETHLTLNLRTDVQMQDGTTLNAEDVQCSLQRYAENNSTSSMNIIFEDIAVVSEYVVDIPFSKAVISNWDDVGARMVFSKEAYEKVNDYTVFVQSADFVSYGPYQITEYVNGDSITMKKFDGYYLGNDSTVNDLVIRRIDEANVAMMELQTEGIDMILYPAQTDINDTIAGKYSNVKYMSCPGIYQQLLRFNLAEGSACSDVRVRQALCYAIDRESVWKGAFESSGYFPDTCATKSLEFMKSVNEPYPYDLEKARALFEEAGVYDNPTLTVCVDNNAYRKTAVEMLKNSLAEIGIDINIKTGDNATFLNDTTGGIDWDFAIGKGGSTGSIANFVNIQWVRFNHGDKAVEDYSDYYELRDTILTTTDETARENLTDEFVSKFYDHWTFFYPLCQDEYATLVNSKLEGFDRVGDVLYVEGMYFTK